MLKLVVEARERWKDEVKDADWYGSGVAGQASLGSGNHIAVMVRIGEEKAIA
jgi:hypothetical protein